MVSAASRYKALLANCKVKGYKVRHVSSRVLKDYAGMNDEAARKLGFKRLKDKTILIDKRLPYKDRLRTLRHEIVEMNLMEKKRYSYWKAHKAALKAEHKRVLRH